MPQPTADLDINKDLIAASSTPIVLAILAEEESGNKVGHEPGDEVGVHELMGMRSLLATAKTSPRPRGRCSP